MASDAPLILTLRLDAASSVLLNGLRERHFPPERNWLAAHVTLFHALPGAHEDAVRDALARVCRQFVPFPVHFPALRSLGRGVAVDIDAPELLRLRARLGDEWAQWLTPQDRQRYRPHVTIQNKVTSEQARALLDELSASWQPVTAAGEGLLLWRYLGGPWEAVGEFPFESLTA